MGNRSDWRQWLQPVLQADLKTSKVPWGLCRSTAANPPLKKGLLPGTVCPSRIRHRHTKQVKIPSLKSPSESKSILATTHLHLAQQGVPEASQAKSNLVELWGWGTNPPAPRPPHQRPHQGLGSKAKESWKPHTSKLRSTAVHHGTWGCWGSWPPRPCSRPPSPANIINSKLFFFMTPNSSKPNSSFHHYLSHRSH